VTAAFPEAFYSTWIRFDAFLVSITVLENFDAVNFNPSVLRLIRLVRLGRLLKLIRYMKALDSLFLLLRSVQASVHSCLWAFVLLLGVAIAGGMVLHQLLFQLFEHPDPEAQKAAFYYFGNFTKTLATMFEITFANWVPSCRTLMDHYGDSYVLFYIIYRCLICFAILRVVTAVFIAETNRIVAADTEIAIKKRQQNIKKQTADLRALFAKLDASGDGYLSVEEFSNAFDDPIVKNWAESMDVEVRNVRETFEMIDDGDGLVTIDEFMDGFAHLRGYAKGHDIYKLLRVCKRLDAKLDDCFDQLQADLSSFLGPAKKPDVRGKQSTIRKTTSYMRRTRI